LEVVCAGYVIGVLRETHFDFLAVSIDFPNAVKEVRIVVIDGAAVTAAASAFDSRDTAGRGSETCGFGHQVTHRRIVRAEGSGSDERKSFALWIFLAVRLTLLMSRPALMLRSN